MIELLSIDLSNYCSKQCDFCYNHSTKEGNTVWTPQEVIGFVSDCIEHGVKAVSLGGGEPLEYNGIFDIIAALYPKCYLSITTNGLPLLKENILNKLKVCKPDKMHVTIHQPKNSKEVDRVIKQIQIIQQLQIKPGVNLLVGADSVDYVRHVYQQARRYLNPEQIILIPQRYGNTPTAKDMAMIVEGESFQSPSCLLGCKQPQKFVSVSWDKKINFCSYAGGKEQMETLNFEGLQNSLDKVAFASCL